MVCPPLVDLDAPLPYNREPMTPRVCIEESAVYRPVPPFETQEKYQEKEFLSFAPTRKRRRFKPRMEQVQQMKDRSGRACVY